MLCNGSERVKDSFYKGFWESHNISFRDRLIIPGGDRGNMPKHL